MFLAGRQVNNEANQFGIILKITWLLHSSLWRHLLRRHLLTLRCVRRWLFTRSSTHRRVCWSWRLCRIWWLGRVCLRWIWLGGVTATYRMKTNKSENSEKKLITVSIKLVIVLAYVIRHINKIKSAYMDTNIQISDTKSYWLKVVSSVDHSKSL